MYLPASQSLHYVLGPLHRSKWIEGFDIVGEDLAEEVKLERHPRVLAGGLGQALHRHGLRQGVDISDVVNGLIKSFFFAVCIGDICCHQGLTTRGGPRGIGRSVTKAVVNSLVVILVLDYVLTRLLLPFDSAFGH